MCENKIGDEGGLKLAEALKVNKGLKYVNLSKNELSDSVVSKLERCSRAELYLSMQKCRPGPVSITTFGSGGTFTTSTYYY